MTLPVALLSELDREEFVARIGWVFEESPWIAATAWERRPFTSVDELVSELRHAARGATPKQAVALLRAHPPLAAGGADDAMTPASVGEQRSSGLFDLAPADRARLAAAQRAYRQRFGFPYVVCVRERNAGELFADLERRLEHDGETELRTALAQVERIAELRVRDVVENGR